MEITDEFEGVDDIFLEEDDEINAIKKEKCICCSAMKILNEDGICADCLLESFENDF